jgi:uncharacterized protein (TIGR00369 family)
MAKLSELGVDFEHWCFACGRQNPAGLHLEFDVGRDRAETVYVAEQKHQGWDGMLHGGVLAALLDETMAWAIFHQGIWTFTAKLNVTYRKAAALGAALRAVGEVQRDRGRALDVHGTVTRLSDGEVIAEADGLYVRIPDERRRELEKRYAASAEAFARVRSAVAAEDAGREREAARS